MLRPKEGSNCERVISRLSQEPIQSKTALHIPLPPVFVAERVHLKRIILPAILKIPLTHSLLQRPFIVREYTTRGKHSNQWNVIMATLTNASA